MRALKKFALLMTILALITAPVSLFLSPAIAAAELEHRSIRLDSSLVNIVTSHNFRFDTITAINIGSIKFEYCSNSPIVEEPCTAPVGFDASGAVLLGQSGLTGFSILPSLNPNEIILRRPSALALPQTADFRFGNITNASSFGSQYARVRTFVSEDATTGQTDIGGLAYALVNAFSVSAFVPPYLMFCAAISVLNFSCAQASGYDINFGQFSWRATSYATSQMMAATNAEYGYNISVTGTTMTAGVHTIRALATPTTSGRARSQFGLNLRDNSTPDVGANPAGPGTALPVADYNQPDYYMFEDRDTLVSIGVPNDKRTFTVSYIVNVNPFERPGVYSTTLSYTALANF